MLSTDDLATAVAADEIDTVVVAFPDMQGRLMGKRVRATFFSTSWAETVARSRHATICWPSTWT